MDDDRLQILLRDVGVDVVFPDTPPIVDDVLERLGEQRTRRSLGLRVAAVAAAVMIITITIPGPRRAIAELFGLGGVSIVSTEDLPRAPIAEELPGRPVTLQEARSGADFTLLVPDGYGDPAAVSFDETVPGGLVTLAFGPGPESYGLVITEMIGSLDRPLLEKVVGPDTTVTPVVVGEGDGFWIEGAPHLVLVLDRNGRDRVDDPRLVANTLLFVRDGVTVRIESALGLDDAHTIAEALVPHRP